MDIKKMNNSEKEFIQSRLKERRLSLNITFDDLAKQTGIARSSLQRYENGYIQNISLDKIYILSKALETTPDYFLTLTDDYSEQNSSKSENRYIDLEEFTKFKEGFKQYALEKISPKLISDGYRVEKRSRIGDLTATKGNEIWHFSFIYYNNKRSSSDRQNFNSPQILFKYGRITTYENPITKYSFVVDNSIVADQILRHRPVHLNIPISIILLKEQGYEELHFN